MKEKDLAWQLFKSTGKLSYYSLYKRLSEGKDDIQR